MCSRRHKGLIQTSVILVLIGCVGYAYYLHNLLQVKIDYLNKKASRHQSQHQSASSQLQAAQEDRAGLETAVQKAKSDYQKLKEEREAMIKQMMMEHQDKYGALEGINKALQDKNKQLALEKDNLQAKHNKVRNDHEELKNTHQKALTDYEKEKNMANEELEEYKNQNQAIERLRDSLEQEIHQARGDYQSLQDALKAIPADAVNFNHPIVRNIQNDVKRLLLGHLGERRDELDQAQQQQRVQQQQQPFGGQQQQNVQQGSMPQQIGGGFPAAQEGVVVQKQQHPPDSNIVDTCQLKLDHGPCDSEEMRYGFRVDVNDCRGFIYGGCGGNENNFPSIDICRSSCSDSSQRYVRKQNLEQTRYNDHAAVGNAPPENQLPYHNTPQDIHHVVGQPVQEENIPDNDVLAKGLVSNSNQVVEEPAQNGLRSDEQRDIHSSRQQPEQEDKVPKNIEKDDEESRLAHVAEIQAKGAEEDAKRELESQQQFNQEEDPLERLKENSRLQMQLAQDQHESMEKVLNQKRRDEQVEEPIIHAQIVGKEEDENDKGDRLIHDGEQEESDEDDMRDAFVGRPNQEDDAQVVLPPAAPVAGQDPEVVMNAPPAEEHAQIDLEEVKGLFELGDGNELQGHQEEGDSEFEENGHEEEEEEEEGDYNQNPIRDFGDDDKVDDQKFEDPYANEEEGPEEEKYRKEREEFRIKQDEKFESLNELMKAVPDEMVGKQDVML